MEKAHILHIEFHEIKSYGGNGEKTVLVSFCTGKQLGLYDMKANRGLVD